jgi:wobble nucleotide-excising tRNase
MRILRLPKIKQQRVFRNYIWPAELPTFAQYNVIYGWNGTGKTTLSSLFANLQDNRAIAQGEVEFELDNGNKLFGASLVTATTPPVRVFNRDFVTKTIESIGQGNVAPIYFLGAESIEQQKQVEVLKTELEAARKAVIEADGAKLKADKALDEFCIEKGKLIREALLGSAQHANYDKRSFNGAVTKLKRQSPQPAVLSNEQKQSLRKQKELQAKPSVSHIIFTLPNLESLHSQTSDLLKRSVVSQVIDALVNEASVATWVQQGLALHKGEHETDTCRFCGNGFSAERRAELEGHFNDAFAAFQREIDAAVRTIDGQRKSLAGVVFPDVSRIYDNLVSNYQDAVKTVKQDLHSVDQVLNSYKEALERKRATPFEVLSLDISDTRGNSGETILKAAIDAVNAIIDKHEETTSHLETKIKQACEKLEQDYVLEALPRFDELSKASSEAEAALAAVNEKPEELRKQIEKIERTIVEHRRPAEELNRELRTYSGRDELQFAVKETGYALTRGGKPAQHLSEGERTAIAFLYFLKSLEDKAFDLSKGIVVIDDPVSSLDANALFSAFGYM